MAQDSKKRLRVEIPTDDYWKRQVKCQDACPVNTDARRYIKAIRDGEFDKAYSIARGPNPLASICGRICGAPCEEACRRGSLDASISIRELKRSAVDQSGAISLSQEDTFKQLEASTENRNSGINDLGVLLGNIDAGDFVKAEGQSVGIIGSGPAGLAAAHDLAIMGFSPVIYEMEPVAAGMLYLGIPAYRLPREVIENEIKVIKSLGVEIKTGCTVGVDVTFPELRERHDAVLIAVGCKRPRKLPIPGIDGEGVFGGVDFLRAIALGLPHETGSKVVVIGGGNVAFDIARTALRRQQMDIAVAAVRDQEGANNVTLCCLEEREEMLSDEIEVIEAEEEGVDRLNGYGPQEILLENGKAKGVLFHRVVSIFDEDNRFNPKYDPNDSKILDADVVLLAVGQTSDLSFLDPERDGLKLERGIVHDKETLETDASAVYVAGDLATGPGLMIDAVANGKRAARSIYQKVTGRTLERKTKTSHSVIAKYAREMGYEKLGRHETDTADVSERIKNVHAIVAKGFERSEAITEASRCLNCCVNTIFDGSKCVLCGGCQDVCPMCCLKLVSVSNIDGTQPEYGELETMMKDRKDTDQLTAIIKDEECCIRCGLCAVRCPADAITMEEFDFTEQAT